jgi:hypothetical protein
LKVKNHRGRVVRADDRRTIRAPHTITIETLTLATLAGSDSAMAACDINAAITDAVIAAHPRASYRPMMDAHILNTGVYSALARLQKAGTVTVRIGRDAYGRQRHVYQVSHD